MIERIHATDEETAQVLLAMKKHISDLQKELRTLKADLSMWTRIGHMAFTHSEGCLEGCRRACMCTCGYEHYVAQVAQEAKRD